MDISTFLETVQGDLAQLKLTNIHTEQVIATGQRTQWCLMTVDVRNGLPVGASPQFVNKSRTFGQWACNFLWL